MGGSPLTCGRFSCDRQQSPERGAGRRRSEDGLVGVTTDSTALEHTLPESDRPPPPHGQYPASAEIGPSGSVPRAQSEGVREDTP